MPVATEVTERLDLPGLLVPMAHPVPLARSVPMAHSVPDGPPGADGLARDLPTLQGHIPMFPEDNFHGNGVTGLDDDRVLPYDVQAAFNNDTFFWRVSYRSNEGKRHEYIRYTNGAWQREGGDRRDAQATLDGDAQQGDLTINSTIYEQRTTIMVNDPNALTDVTNFDKFGCFLTCHNVSRHMPEWVSASGHDGKYIDPAEAPGVAEFTPVLDLWHWRAARSNPIGRADDQHIISLNFVDSSSGDDGGRKGDDGASVFTSQNIVNGVSEFLLDPDTTSGKFAFAWDNFWETPFYYMVKDNAEQVGPLAPNPGTIAYADALALGYAPTEGDTVPRRILRAGTGSRADITAYGTTFNPETPDSSYGVWNVQMQRAMNTGNGDDIALVDGQVYEVASKCTFGNTRRVITTYRSRKLWASTQPQTSWQYFLRAWGRNKGLTGRRFQRRGYSCSSLASLPGSS